MTARPTDEEIAELRRLCDQAQPWALNTPNARLVNAARKWLPRLLALVTQEGGEVYAAVNKALKYSADNTYLRPNGYRDCRECHRLRLRDLRRVRSAARALSDPSGE